MVDPEPALCIRRQLAHRLHDDQVVVEPRQVLGSGEPRPDDTEVPDLPPSVAVQVDRGGPQPRLGVVGPEEALARCGGPHERLLDEVLGLGGVTHDAVQLDHEAPVGGVEELTQRVVRSCSGLPDGPADRQGLGLFHGASSFAGHEQDDPRTPPLVPWCA
jgi:hypothetical protein